MNLHFVKKKRDGQHSAMVSMLILLALLRDSFSLFISNRNMYRNALLLRSTPTKTSSNANFFAHNYCMSSRLSPLPPGFIIFFNSGHYVTWMEFYEVEATSDTCLFPLILHELKYNCIENFDIYVM